MPCARESQGLLEQKREAPRRLTHRTSCNALKICKLGGGTSEEERIYISKEELDKADAQIGMVLKMFAESAKYDDNGDLKISPMGAAFEAEYNHGVEWIAYCINLSIVIATPQMQDKIGELLAMQGVDVYQLPLITKEQFYTLE